MSVERVSYAIEGNRRATTADVTLPDDYQVEGVTLDPEDFALTVITDVRAAPVDGFGFVWLDEKLQVLSNADPDPEFVLETPTDASTVIDASNFAFKITTPENPTGTVLDIAEGTYTRAQLATAVQFVVTAEALELVIPLAVTSSATGLVWTSSNQFSLAAADANSAFAKLATSGSSPLAAVATVFLLEEVADATDLSGTTARLVVLGY